MNSIVVAQKDFTDPELLAPAGSLESLSAAIQAGCDSVYFGVTQLNMRARSASNFDLADLNRIVQTAHAHNKKAYLALNSLLYPHDIRLMGRLLERAKECEVDAVILADVAAIEKAHSLKIPVHISTQLSVSNLETVRFWSRYADTIVLARELTLPMIQTITQGIQEKQICGPSGEPLKIEIFAHGALCIAVSGRCGMSLYTSNASANRGACIQNCRKPYVVIDKETGMELEIDNEYVMSPKDICTIDFLDKVLASGVSVLKIEGRGRSPEYVHEVVSCYREAITSIKEKNYTSEKIVDWRRRLSEVYNRGLSDGYYLGQKQGWSVTPNNQARKEKVFAGEVVHYYPKAGVMQVQLMAHPIRVGDELIITGHTTGLLKERVRELRTEDDQSVEQANHPALLTLPVKERVRIRDRVYIFRERKKTIEITSPSSKNPEYVGKSLEVPLESSLENSLAKHIQKEKSSPKKGRPKTRKGA